MLGGHDASPHLGWIPGRILGWVQERAPGRILGRPSERTSGPPLRPVLGRDGARPLHRVLVRRGHSGRDPFGEFIQHRTGRTQQLVPAGLLAGATGRALRGEGRGVGK
ncbi:hypothetical protein A5728_09805 [Kocuria sp. ICS0012]|nr:hypothetical protein A5728_09805 [Kocuria sp. ICS0012]